MRVLETNIPDIIVLDIEMPKLKDYEVAENIKLRPDLAQIPLIALTAVSLETIGK